MRTIEELIKSVRFSTNEKDENRFPDEMLLEFFNDAQDQIEALVSIANFENSPFDKTVNVKIQTNKTKYQLPADIYAWSAVSDITTETGRKLFKGEDYQIVGKILFLKWLPQNDSSMQITYKSKLPRLEDVTDTPDLPSMCESFLRSFVERRIMAINSSSDLTASAVYTEEEKSLILEIFQDNNSDVNTISEIRDDHGYFEY